MAKKSFFRERTVPQIRALHTSQASRQRALVKRIDSLDPVEEALIVRTQLIPGRFYRGVETGAEASRKCLKHGDKIVLAHPATKDECYHSPLIPLQIRARDFAKLEEMREEDINFVGYSVRPGWGDRTRRVTPFVFLPEGLRLFAYSENMAAGIEVKSYPDAKRVAREGADVVVSVPSRTKKQPRYQYRLVHVPMVRSPHNLATVLTLRPAVLQKGGEPARGRTAHEDFLARYTYESDPESSAEIVTYPHDVAAYLGIVKDELEKHNMTPMEMNPHALFSRRGAKFAKKLCNNVLIYDPTLRGKEKLRKLHLAEKSILLARAIGEFGHDEIAFWEPARDGRLKDYDWGFSQE
jgi:hypothetical protein